MRKISLFAVATALTVAGVGGWAASTTKARVAPSIGPGIEPFKLMMNAKELPAVEFVDYTFVFHLTTNKRNLFCHRGVANPSMDCAQRRKWRRVFPMVLSNVEAEQGAAGSV